MDVLGHTGSCQMPVSISKTGVLGLEFSGATHMDATIPY